MLHWSEQLHCVYIAGQNCEMKNRAAVAELLSVEWYANQWPLIPRPELDASAVDFPYFDSEYGEWTSKKVLMHKRRVSEDHLNGTAKAKVCADCYEAFWKASPTLSKWSLSNYNWLGRHLPIFRDATLGHQLLLALGRVVSTKVYLSSKGVDVVTRQHNQSWRKKFLQQGMSGTAIVYGNGSADDAMASFPPEDDVLQDSFMAVFTGPETDIILSEAEKEEQARAALRNEKELYVCRSTYEEQAKLLMDTNYVYAKRKAGYKPKLVEKFPEEPKLPSCFEVCAKFIPARSDAEDVTVAEGPAASTTAAQQEKEDEENIQELDKFVSVLEENHDEISELTSLPALQGLLEKMESMAGRVVANELMAVVESGEYGAQDEIGRDRLKRLSQEFHYVCSKVNRDQELENLHWRVQALATGQKYTADPENADQATTSPGENPTVSPTDAPPSVDPSAQRPAQLRVPTSRKPESWWSPDFWSIARPTDFCYGDCVWGFFGLQPVTLAIHEWINM